MPVQKAYANEIGMERLGDDELAITVNSETALIVTDSAMVQLLLQMGNVCTPQMAAELMAQFTQMLGTALQGELGPE